MAFILLLVMLTACAASPEDLCGKVMIFPEETSTAFVNLTTSQQTFSAATVCLRSITDLRRSHALFSVSTPSANNAFLIFKSTGDVINFNVQNKLAKFGDQDYKVNAWQSICATWDSASSLVQLWLDGKPSIKKHIDGSNIMHPITILGQDQDSHGGKFDKRQSFVGMISEVHMWDHVIPSCEIEHYMADLHYTAGNLINWRSLEFEIFGNVQIEDVHKSCLRLKGNKKHRW